MVLPIHLYGPHTKLLTVPHKPSHCILQGGVQHMLDHLSHLCVRRGSGPTRTILVRQPFNAILREPPAPFSDNVLIDTEAFGNLLALKTLGAQQHHSIRQRSDSERGVLWRRT